ncbi:MAG: hypothetical protein M0C28_06690 [Candidatus Moduliflexus flocculans]|nr:hypothetical protein [Candidatus Moduliflexus flocculans]
MLAPAGPGRRPRRGTDGRQPGLPYVIAIAGAGGRRLSGDPPRHYPGPDDRRFHSDRSSAGPHRPAGRQLAGLRRRALRLPPAGSAPAKQPAPAGGDVPATAPGQPASRRAVTVIPPGASTPALPAA